MQKVTKKRLKIFAVALATVLLLCAIFAGLVVLPQFTNKNKRYEHTKSFFRGEVQTIAHRGLSGLALENTLSAFEKAGTKSYYGIETDVRLTKDGEFILAHDSDLRRFGLDEKIAERTFAELRALRFRDIYGSSEEENCFLPSLDEYLHICKTYGKQAVMEIKGAMPADKILELVQAVDAFDWLERSIFLSFDRADLLTIRSAYPDANVQYVIRNMEKGDIEFMIEHKIDADLCWTAVTPSRVRKLKKAGRKVNCWTVDGRACAWYMRFCGVDMITTNILE
ncbi:MAG: hypothetical protein E7381_01630 [Clostridiales bacterium]|nr:hypothetical protein [Clostridiales bacterium]